MILIVTFYSSYSAITYSAVYCIFSLQGIRNDRNIKDSIIVLSMHVSSCFFSFSVVILCNFYCLVNANRTNPAMLGS